LEVVDKDTCVGEVDLDTAEDTSVDPGRGQSDPVDLFVDLLDPFVGVNTSAAEFGNGLPCESWGIVEQRAVEIAVLVATYRATRKVLKDSSDS